LRRHGGAGKLIEERRSRFYRAVWDEAGVAQGCSVRELGQTLEIRRDGMCLRVRNNLTSLDDPVTLRVAGDKPLVYRLLQGAAVPVPAHVVCRAGDVAAARRFMAANVRPCVVKPARRTAAGAGVSTGIDGLASLLPALARAGALCDEVIVEQEVGGDNLRLLYLDGELLDAVRRRAPTAVGDGTSTIRGLVEAENADRLLNGIEASQTLLTIDRELRTTLRKQRYGLRSVPPRGAVVKLKGVVNDNRGSDNEAVDPLSADVVAAGARAAAAVGARLSGVDVITPDPSLPLDEVGGVVIEVNTTPGYYYHYHKRDGRAPVATMILERLVTAES
jgi:cyanophycin synthetase